MSLILHFPYAVSQNSQHYVYMIGLYIWDTLYPNARVAPDTYLAGYPAAEYPANIFTGYPVSGRISG